MSEVKIAPVLIESTRKSHPELIKNTEYLQGDKGFDSSSFICTLWDNYTIELLAKLSFFKKLLLGRKVKLLLYNVLTFLKVLANFKPYEF